MTRWGTTMASLMAAGTCLLAVAAQAEVTAIQLNQTGFTANSGKIAIVVTDREQPIHWRILSANGIEVASGQTTPFGENAGSKERVHQADFSRFRAPGQGYVLTVNGTQSQPFDIGRVYQPLKYDALAFFYHQRSGVPIEAQYVGEKWARPIAHEKEVVTCWGPKDHRGNEWGGCPYELDASRGWYDAGDHGKYVVNSGISVWTLLNIYEYGLADGFTDGKVKIPEAGNGVNDLLDEARFNLDFMLGMQVPEGQSLTLPLGNQRENLIALKFTKVDASGMAHHKLHDENWTAVPTPPHLDREKRGLSYPSTGATLNLAATAAQCARLFKGVDDAYADKCLTAARRAYEAALRVPDAYAIDVLAGGGGGYGDYELSDEFYWAAAELYLTTGEETYLEALKASPHYLSVADFNWGNVPTLGTISLAVSAPDELKQAARAAIVSRARALKAETATQGYAVPFDRAYRWGSTADFMNRAIILALGADFADRHGPQYAPEVVNLTDYVLGRNPLGFSFVSGYGEKAMQHPHHRFWTNDGTLPPPPPGVIAGGANQRPSEVDPEALRRLEGCHVQTCYIDHISSYSTNEVTINWNAPLVWVASWLDVRDAGSGR